jgi:hypothetical protein
VHHHSNLVAVERYEKGKKKKIATRKAYGGRSCKNLSIHLRGHWVYDNDRVRSCGHRVYDNDRVRSRCFPSMATTTQLRKSKITRNPDISLDTL